MYRFRGVPWLVFAAAVVLAVVAVALCFAVIVLTNPGGGLAVFDSPNSRKSESPCEEASGVASTHSLTPHVK